MNSVETQIGKRLQELGQSNIKPMSMSNVVTGLNSHLEGYKYNLISEAVSSLNGYIDRHIIAGLKIQGYEFKDMVDLVNFVAENCRVEDRPDVKEKTFIVKDVPFLVHKYNNLMDTKILTQSDGSIKATLSLGEFVYL